MVFYSTEIRYYHQIYLYTTVKPSLVSKFSHLSSIWAEYFKKCTRWWILGLNSCCAVKGRLRLHQGNVVTFYSHTSLMCEIPGSTVICIHPSTDHALLQPAWHRVRGDVTPTGVCFSILFQGQEKLQGCDIICLLCDRQLRSITHAQRSSLSVTLRRNASRKWTHSFWSDRTDELSV